MSTLGEWRPSMGGPEQLPFLNAETPLVLPKVAAGLRLFLRFSGLSQTQWQDPRRRTINAQNRDSR
jgi:hypothetical protein